MIVNNNAAAVFMILRTFAKGKEVLVSRGELVEIGGSFRVSSIMAESDAQLIEVGTTNKTRIEDYAENLTENTAMVMKVHQSNFKIIGFTEAASRQELAELAAKHGLLFYEDLGSGALFDYGRLGFGQEPVIPNIIKEGVDLLSASGDKLFGGPQAGIILGKKHLIDRLKKHPLARTFRTDKMTIASLGATLQSYLSEKLEVEIPTVRDVVADAETIKTRAIKLKKALALYPSIQAEIVPLTSRVGGGAMPDVPIKSYGVKIQSSELPAQTLADRLRTGTPSVIGRIEEAHVLLDCRTITDEEIDLVGQAFAKLDFKKRL
jgi:L-seryl-tRNA(Ser) seleniumtransferase